MNNDSMMINYALSPDREGPGFFRDLIVAHNARCVLEVGSGANPLLPPTFVRERGIAYITSDIDPTELAKADPVYEAVLLDLTVPIADPALLGRFDLVFSTMVGEHIPDAHSCHANIFRLLQPGGYSVHHFASLWTLPFVFNRLLPDSLTDRILDLIHPRDRHQHEKFPAHYDWCRGPSAKMIARFQKLGFEVVRYTGYFGHGYYSKKLPWLDRLEWCKARFLLNHPIPQLCSFATVVLRKPLAAASNSEVA